MTSPNNFRAIIFDCDGTLADTMPAHYEAWVATLEAHNISFSEDRFYDLGGTPTHRIVEMFAEELGITLDVKAITDEKENRFLEHLDLIRPIEPVAAVARGYHGSIPMAVATGAMRSVGERILRQIGLFDLFDAIVCADDTSRHKPEPDVFLEAASRINMPPGDCLVYEDTDPGLEAARRAGMRAIDVRSFYSPRRVT